MTIRRRTTFPGLDARANRELIGLQDDLLTELKGLRQEAIGQTTDTKQGPYAARFNERIRCLAPTAGLDLTFPGSTSQTQNRWIEVLKLGGGNVRIRPTSGTIQGAASLTLTTAGFYYFQSDGTSGWWIQPIGGGGIADGVYGSITVSGGGTIFRVTDGVYGSVTVSGGGLVWTVAPATVSMTDATFTLPFAGKQSDVAVVVDAAITALSRIGIFWGTTAQTDENHPEMDAVSFVCSPTAGGMIVRVTANAPESRVGGPYKIRYLIG